MSLQPIPDYGLRVHIAEFKACCECGGFIDYDGYGHPVVNELMNEDVVILPSKYRTIPEEIREVVWFNR